MTRLFVATDFHECGGIPAGRKLAGGRELVSDLIHNQLPRFEADAFVDLGDQIEDSSSPEADLNNLRAVLKPFDSLTIPHLHCIGNHPLINLAESLVAHELPRYGSQFPYFATNIKDHRIIMLHSRFSAPDGSGIYIDQPQLDWLKDNLDVDRPVLVCCHHPLSDHDLTGNYWFENHREAALMSNGAEVRKIFNDAGNVVAVLNGHTHWNHLNRDEFGTTHITLQSLVEDFSGKGIPARTFADVKLKGAALNLEIHGNDKALRGKIASPEQIADDLRHTYNAIATNYDLLTSQFGKQEHDQFDRLIPLLQPGHSKTIIDFGCGPGRDFPHYLSRGFNPIGVDGSEGLLARARLRSPNQSFIHANFGEAPLSPGTASIAIHNSTLQHVPRESLDRVLKEAFDALEPGGIFYCHYRTGIGETLSISTEYGVAIARFIALYTEEEMNAALERAGFEILASDTRDHGYEGLKGVVVKDKSHSWARKPGKPLTV